MSQHLSNAVGARGVVMVDVARRAGVSQKTVSRVVNNAPYVRPGRSRQVSRAIEELGYRPNGAAQALARERTHTLGVLALGHSVVRAVPAGVHPGACGAPSWGTHWLWCRCPTCRRPAWPRDRRACWRAASRASWSRCRPTSSRSTPAMLRAAGGDQRRPDRRSAACRRSSTWITGPALRSAHPATCSISVTKPFGMWPARAIGTSPRSGSTGWRSALQERGAIRSAGCCTATGRPRSGYRAGSAARRSRQRSPPSSPPTTTWPWDCFVPFTRPGRSIPGDVSVVGFDDVAGGGVPDGAVDDGGRRRRRGGAADPRRTRADDRGRARACRSRHPRRPTTRDPRLDGTAPATPDQSHALSPTLLPAARPLDLSIHLKQVRPSKGQRCLQHSLDASS